MSGSWVAWNDLRHFLELEYGYQPALWFWEWN